MLFIYLTEQFKVFLWLLFYKGVESCVALTFLHNWNCSSYFPVLELQICRLKEP